MSLCAATTPTSRSRRPVRKIRFEDSGGKDVCIVSVASAGKAVFAKPLEGKGSGPTEFWVRNGNKTEQLHADDMTDYMTLH